jgi:simple sugar transport system ATP-binding protein
VLGYHRKPEYSKGPLLDLEAIRKDAMEKIEKYDIRPPNPRLKTANFSGGNQQKIVVAREIERDPTALIIGQPTRGVDIGAIEFIHSQIAAMRDEGSAVLLVSVELDEILALSDRIVVMFQGRIVGETTRELADERQIGLWMANAQADPSADAGDATQPLVGAPVTSLGEALMKARTRAGRPNKQGPKT